LRLRWHHYGLMGFLAQEQLLADALMPFNDELRNASTPFEIHLYHWCVETLIPFLQLPRGAVHVAFYENFCTEPRQELERLFEFFGKTHDRRVFEYLGRPSSQTNRKGALPPGASLVHTWRQQLTQDQIARVKEVTRRFGLDGLYRENGTPNRAAADALWAG